MNRPFLGGALLCAAMAAPSAWAQSHDAHGAHALPAKPAASTAASAPAKAESSAANTDSLAGYRAYTEPALAPWRQSNAQVAKAGGWRAYARESQAPANPAASGPVDASSKASAPENKQQSPHSGHAH